MNCVLPFSHLYHFTDGSTYPCPKLVSNKNYILGKNEDSVETLFNNEILKKMRLQFINKNPPSVCIDHCFNSLSPTNKCVRSNTEENIVNFYNNVNESGFLDTKFYTIKNIPESNICNLKCVYCDGNHSSRHNKNEIIFSFQDDGFREKFLYNIENIKECWFSSGESFLQPNYFWALMELKKRNLENVKVSIITNGTILNEKTKLFLSVLNSFKDPHILFSVDSIEKRFEIIRQGSNWNDVLENIKYIRDNYKNIRMIFQPVISILNILHLKELHYFLMTENLIKSIGDVRLYHLNGPSFLNIKNIKNKKIIRLAFND